MPTRGKQISFDNQILLQRLSSNRCTFPLALPFGLLSPSDFAPSGEFSIFVTQGKWIGFDPGGWWGEDYRNKRTLLTETHVFSSWDDVKLSPRDSLRFSFKCLIYCSYFIMATTTRILPTDQRQSTLLYIWQCPARFLQSYFNLPKRYCSITLKLPSLAQKWSFNSSAESNSDHSYLALEWHRNIQWP